MKIIEQSWEWIQKPVLPLQTIETAGRTCYKSEDKIGCVNKDKADKAPKCVKIAPDNKSCVTTECPDHSSHKFAATLIKSGHETVIEHVSASIKIITNRGVTHELVRHRLFSFSQESTRYVKYDGNMEFIKPVWIKGDINSHGTDFEVDMSETDTESGAIYEWLSTMSGCEASYKNLLDSGWRPEQAREVLPNSLKTEIVATANFREWRHTFNLRCSKAAHPQIRAIMLDILKAFNDEFPVIFTDLAEKYL